MVFYAQSISAVISGRKKKKKKKKTKKKTKKTKKKTKKTTTTTKKTKKTTTTTKKTKKKKDLPYNAMPDKAVFCTYYFTFLTDLTSLLFYDEVTTVLYL